MGFWDTDIYFWDALREFDESEPICDVIAAQVGRSTGWSGGGCADPNTSIVQTHSNACHLPDHVVIARKESEDSLKAIFAERGWCWRERDSGVIESEAGLIDSVSETVYGIFCKFMDDPDFLPNAPCLIKYVPKLHQFHVVGMKFFLGRDHVVEDTKMVSRLRDFDECLDLYVDKVPETFKDFPHVESFYQTELGAYDLLDRYSKKRYD